jgi:hypothetical protein
MEHLFQKAFGAAFRVGTADADQRVQRSTAGDRSPARLTE